MLKYYMIIDGTEYNALFIDHFEAGDFLDANDADGSEVIVLRYETITVREALADSDFSDAYAIEMVASYLMPNEHFKKWEDAEKALHKEFPHLF